LKRFILALAVAAGLAAAAYGAAASLIIQDTTTLQVGTTNLVCDSNGVTLNFTTDGASLNPAIDNVTILDIASECVGKKIRMDFFNGASYVTSWNPIGPLTSPSLFYDGANVANAASITQVVVTLYDN